MSLDINHNKLTKNKGNNLLITIISKSLGIETMVYAYLHLKLKVQNEMKLYWNEKLLSLRRIYICINHSFFMYQNLFFVFLSFLPKHY